jgi:surface protein
MLKLVVLVALAGLVAAQTPTASPTFSAATLRDNSATSTSAIKLAHDKYVTNTKASFAAAEPLYKTAVVDFGKTFGAGSLLTKSAKKRYNTLLAHDCSKPAAEQAFACCEDSCSPGGTYTGTGSFAACTANYCDVYQVGGSFRNRCTPGDPNHNFALLECQKTCGICVGKTPFAASELSFTKTTHQGRCSSALPTSATYVAQSKRTVNPDMAGSVVLVDCADGLQATLEGDHVVAFLRCDWNAQTTLYEWVAHGTCEIPPPAYVFQDSAALKTAAALWTSDRAAALTTYGHISTNWDTSKVTNMRSLFANAATFNDPIGAWNTSQVTSMAFMFHGAAAFNQPIGAWDTSKVTSMAYMFRFAIAFNQPLATWDTSNVVYWKDMFKNAAAFNQPISAWDTSRSNKFGLVRGTHAQNLVRVFDGATAMTYPMP